MNKERILIVDSDIAFSEMQKARLEGMGYLVNSVHNGKDALEALKVRWVDLIVMDVVLKGDIKGLALFNKIKKKKEYSSIPILVQSYKSSLMKTMDYMGAELFIAKPFPVDMFLAEVKDILTPKIMVFGEEDPTRDTAVKKLASYDMHIDIISDINRFFQNILLSRYDLIVMQCKIKKNTADKLAFLVRGSAKNRDVPILIYETRKTSNIRRGGDVDVQMVKMKCSYLDKCTYMDSTMFSKGFFRMAGLYLDGKE